MPAWVLAGWGLFQSLWEEEERGRLSLSSLLFIFGKDSFCTHLSTPHLGTGFLAPDLPDLLPSPCNVS